MQFMTAACNLYTLDCKNVVTQKALTMNDETQRLYGYKRSKFHLHNILFSCDE